MRIVRIALIVLLATTVTACAHGWRMGQPFGSSDRTRVEEQLMFLDRLSAASPDRLTVIGRDLRAKISGSAGVVASMHYALWLSMPGHPGHDPEAARHRFEALLADEATDMDDGSRALVRIRLREMRREAARAEEQARRHDDLVQQNKELREKIQALTTLEKEMGGTNDQPKNP